MALQALCSSAGYNYKTDNTDAQLGIVAAGSKLTCARAPAGQVHPVTSRTSKEPARTRGEYEETGLYPRRGAPELIILGLL